MYDADTFRLATIRKQLPQRAMDLFLAAANRAEAEGGGYNDHVRAGWDAVRNAGYERRANKQWALRRDGPTAADVHVNAPLGSRGERRRRRPPFVPDEPRKAAPRTLYVSRRLLNGDDVRAWAAEQGFESTLPAEEMYVTLAFSKEPVDWELFTPDEGEVVVEGGEREVHQFPARLTENGATVLLFSSDDLTARWGEFVAAGASWDFPSYRSHITITYQATPDEASGVEPYAGPLIFGPEEFAEIRQDLAAAGSGGAKVEFEEEPLTQIDKVGARHSRGDVKMLQQIHDHAVDLGAACPGKESAASKMGGAEVRILKLDDEQRIVWGWASVSTVKGELVRDGERDMIEPDVLERAATEFMKGQRTHGAMHRYDWVIKGDDLLKEPVEIGTVIHSLPLTNELMRMFGIECDVEGWIIGAHVTDDAEWAKYKSGEYQAFSIGGRSEFHPADAAA